MSAVSLSDDRPIDPDDESLVAYLDGELQPQERSQLEQRLLEDESLRVRLQELQQSWDWLEQLPTTTPNEKMVESTLELVVSDIVEATPAGPSWYQRLRTPLWVLIALIVPPLLAVGCVQLKRNADYRRQLKDLAIAENVEAYLEADDLDLVRELASHAKWNQMIRAAREVGLIPLDSTPLIADVPVEQREATLDELSFDQRISLAARWDRFTQLPPETKSHVRQTHEVVAQQTDAETLVKTMKDYAAWKETLQPQRIDEIEGRAVESEAGAAKSKPDLARQRDALDEAIEETVAELTNRSGTGLDDETVESIYGVLEYIVNMRLSRDEPATVQLVDHLQTRFSNISEVVDEEPEKIAIRAAIHHVLRADGSPPRWPGSPRDLPPLSPLTTDELELIEVVLPKEDQQTLDRVAGSNLEYRLMYLQAWAEEASDRFSPWRRGDESQRERYLSLPEDRRNRADLDDPENLGQYLSPDRRSRGRRRRSGGGTRSGG